VNKVILLARLTRDPETRLFANGGQVTKLGLAYTNRRKQGEEWVDEPMFIDTEAFGGLSGVIEKHLRKGDLALFEGELHLDQWDDKTTGAKRSKHVLKLSTMKMLPKGNGRNAAPDDAPGPNEFAGASDGDIPF
jgi:single-strand DNA-binding protein